MKTGRRALLPKLLSGGKGDMTVYKTAREEILKDWQANLQDFASEHEFPAEATESLQDALEIIGADDRLYAIFRTWEENYWKDPDMDYQTLWATLEALDGTDGISKYTLELLFIIGISRRTRELYEEQGISMEIFHDSMADMHWKLLECHKMYGIWGTFVIEWFPWWFRLKRFALGRLQFERITFEDEYEKDGLILHKDSPVINVHIPSCGPLDPEAFKASYAKAAEFYKEEFQNQPLVFVCNSWLLFPAHKEILPEHSNIRAFMNDFDVYKSNEDNGDLWRIYYGAEEKGFENLPENTGLERAYKKWLMDGHMAGYARGVYLYRPE